MRDVEAQGGSFFKLHPTSSHHLNAREILSALYHWTICLFISALVLAQLLGAVWNSDTTMQHLDYGRDPSLGPFKIVGTNDMPYADRVIACVQYGRKFEPRIVSSLLASQGLEAILEDDSGQVQHGYRLVQRRVGSTEDKLDSAAYASYIDTCSLIASTLDNIFAACAALGYKNLTTDNLRVVESADSNRLFRLPYSLPVLIMPYWDNAMQGRHAIPTWGGDACMFRLEDAYYGDANGANNTTQASLRAVNRTVRYERTLHWLEKPGGVWRNGWYEDLDGGRWFSDVMSSNALAPYYMMFRVFDTRTGTELDCSSQETCLAVPRLDRWGTKFITSDYARDLSSITISNGSWYGIFHYETDQERTVRIVYDWETLVSNLSVGLVLIRWTMALLSLHIGVLQGRLPCFGGGIGCVSSSKSFDLLLVSMLPQLRMTLAAFWTVGCRFEGQQSGLSEAWFTIYPAIAQLMLMYYSLLNLLARLARRRMSDELFAPSVALLCLLHYFRRDLAASGWLEGVDGRVATVVFSDEVKKLKLHDFFTTDVAWRMNGNVTSLVVFKLVVLGINLLPLLLARSFPVPRKGVRRNTHGIEQAFALKAAEAGGLGISPVYLCTTSPDEAAPISTRENLVTPFNQHSTPRKSVVAITPHRPRVYLNSYELVRLGYLLFGDKYVVTFDEWDLLSSMAPFRSYCHLWNHRVVVWTLEDKPEAGVPGFRTLLTMEPEMWRLDDQRLQSICWWRVSSCAIQC
jgi:hypothetical protein